MSDVGQEASPLSHNVSSFTSLLLLLWRGNYRHILTLNLRKIQMPWCRALRIPSRLPHARCFPHHEQGPAFLTSRKRRTAPLNNNLSKLSSSQQMAVVEEEEEEVLSNQASIAATVVRARISTLQWDLKAQGSATEPRSLRSTRPTRVCFRNHR